MEDRFGLVNEVALQAHNAICKYDSDNVDVVSNNGKLDIMYHSDNDSFCIKETGISLDDVDEDSLIDQLDYMSVGHCW